MGSESLAAVASSGSLIFLMVGFFNGTAMGAGVIISKYFGARDYDNLKKAVHTDVAFGLVAGGLLTAIGMVLAPQMLQWMGTPVEVLPNSIAYFRTYFAGSIAFVMYNIVMGILQARTESLFYFLLAFSHCISGILRGAGKSAVPMYVMLIAWCAIRITYITIAVRIVPVVQTIYWAYPLTWSISSVIFLIYYLQADWVHGFQK